MCAYCAKWFPQTGMQQLPVASMVIGIAKSVFSRSVERTLEIAME